LDVLPARREPWGRHREGTGRAVCDVLIGILNIGTARHKQGKG